MIISLEKLIGNEAQSFEFPLCQKDLGDFAKELYGEIGEDGALIQGSIEKLAKNEFLLMFTLSAEMIYPCSRCLEPTALTSEFTFEETIQTAADGLDLIPYVFECLYVNEPSKVLCGSECLGLCPSCGANLNTGECHCEATEELDPRLAELQKLL